MRQALVVIAIFALFACKASKPCDTKKETTQTLHPFHTLEIRGDNLYVEWTIDSNAASITFHKGVEVRSVPGYLYLTAQCNTPVKAFISAPLAQRIRLYNRTFLLFTNSPQSDSLSLTLYDQANGFIKGNYNTLRIFLNHDAQCDFNGSSVFLYLVANDHTQFSSTLDFIDTCIVFHRSDQLLSCKVKDSLYASIESSGNLQVFGRPRYQIDSSGTGRVFFVEP